MSGVFVPEVFVPEVFVLGASLVDVINGGSKSERAYGVGAVRRQWAGGRS
jgi:hypothetical protein